MPNSTPKFWIRSRQRLDTLELRRQLAQAAFARLSEYDRTIAAYLTQSVEHEQFPSTLVLRLMRKEVLRYGENPHQQAALTA